MSISLAQARRENVALSGSNFTVPTLSKKDPQQSFIAGWTGDTGSLLPVFILSFWFGCIYRQDM